ncbi:hypothetical protein TrRE_jg7539 [Triparma retinervis]|uniref:Uncharacterized protein n=1 Tax=Triparma retinervis TaxID=2557542 RepID=A0A9W7A9L9_9STRA|nr:hypothetical protein TrRE_jg7539 [Triparma retinervis]
MGGAKEGVASSARTTPEMLKKSEEADKIIRAAHFAMPDISTIPESSIDDTYDAASVRSKRLIYRAKQRGWLEVDVLLGTWAHHNVPKLDDKALDEFEELVNTDTIEIYNLLTLRTPIPEELDNETVRSIVEWCEGQPLGKASVEGYREAKKEAGLT